jgi:dihydrofolate synthase/folylpolyglutamate synthase
MPEDRPAPLERLQARSHFGIKKGLDNIRALLEAMGSPQVLAPVVLVAGTNGKGSTGAFLAHALRACGLRVGWTTSPHLVSPAERIWVDGAALDAGELATCLEEAFRAEEARGLQATYFELIIAAAFAAFRRARLDLVIAEAGMGGRWDSTNATDPILTVLTNVALDHMEHLGPDRESIAREKLCTARDGRPLVLGPTLDPDWVEPLLECRPRLRPAPLLRAQRVAWDHSVVEGHRVPLAGAHQVENLSTAWEALRALREAGFDLPETKLWAGLEATTWPGRLWTPPGLPGVVMDGAHNHDGARTLAAHARTSGVRPHLLFSAMGDKDLRGMARELLGMAPLSVTLARGENPRYASPEALREAFGLAGGEEVLDLPRAAALLQRPQNAPLLVCGSLYFIGDLLRTLGIQPGIPR